MLKKIALSCLLLVLCTNVLAWHRHHKTSLYINLDKETGNIQLALVIDSADLQKVLQRELKTDSEQKFEGLEEIVLENLVKENADEATKVAMSFINKNLIIKHNNERLKIDWFKIDLHVKVSTLYFQINVKDKDILGLEGLEVTDKFLFDYNTNQVNFIYAKGLESKSYQTSLDDKINSVILK